MDHEQKMPGDSNTTHEGMKAHQSMSHDMSSMHAGHGEVAAPEEHGSHHAMMVADFRKRFWISLGISIPIRAGYLDIKFRTKRILESILESKHERIVQGWQADCDDWFGS